MAKTKLTNDQRIDALVRSMEKWDHADLLEWAQERWRRRLESLTPAEVYAEYRKIRPTDETD